MVKKTISITIEPDKYYSLPVAAKYLGYTNRNGVMYHIEKGTIPAKYLTYTRTISNQRQMIKGEGLLKFKEFLNKNG